MNQTQDRIREVMLWANMTQFEFAKKIGVSPASLSSIFSGRTRPTSMHISAIHKSFPQINVQWLMFGEGDMLLQTEVITPTVSDDLFASVSSSKERIADIDTLTITPNEPSTVSTSRTKKSQADSSSSHPNDPAPSKYNQMEQVVRQVPQGVMGSYDNAASRKVTEIRIFYDNGTYESFFPSKKS